jgi:biopolymer transport protein TolQ
MDPFSGIVLATGILFAFNLSNLAGKVIVIVLFGSSAIVWSIMLAKWREIRDATRANTRFINSFSAMDNVFDMFGKGTLHDMSPFFHIYRAVCETLEVELQERNANLKEVQNNPALLADSDILLARNAGERAMIMRLKILEKNMTLLATAVTAAPFLGLLGTVWGIMDSFSNIVISGSNTLKAVAPGIAGALLTTVVGLLVALPSAIGYNFLSVRIQQSAVDMESFLEELLAEIEKIKQKK